MALRTLVLLDIIDHYLEPTIDSSMIEVVPKTANFHALPSALVLPHIDSGIQRVEQLVIAVIESVLVHCVVAPVDFRVEHVGRDYQALVDGGNDELNDDVQIFRWLIEPNLSFLSRNILSFYPESDGFLGDTQFEVAVRIGDCFSSRRAR